MIFCNDDTFREAALTAFGGLIGSKNGPDNELAYVINECDFTSKAVSNGLTALETRAATLMSNIKANKLTRKQIGAAAGMFEDLSFYLETSDAYDCEDDYVKYVIGGMDKMMDAFEMVVNR